LVRRDADRVTKHAHDVDQARLAGRKTRQSEPWQEGQEGRQALKIFDRWFSSVRTDSHNDNRGVEMAKAETAIPLEPRVLPFPECSVASGRILSGDLLLLP